MCSNKEGSAGTEGIGNRTFNHVNYRKYLSRRASAIQTFSFKQAWKSLFMLLTATLSWDLLGPLTYGIIELRLT